MLHYYHLVFVTNIPVIFFTFGERFEKTLERFTFQEDLSKSQSKQ
jgi:hypothetical protein